MGQKSPIYLLLIGLPERLLSGPLVIKGNNRPVTRASIYALNVWGAAALAQLSGEASRQREDSR